MIKNLKLLRNIGLFDSVSEGAKIDLGKLTLLYADNARGKTTLAEVLRSLADNDPSLIAQRKRLSSSGDPHIVIELDDGSKAVVFQNGKWSHHLPNLAVFDDAFIEKNVYSGLSVSSEHRQNLYDLILGATAVELNNQMDALVSKRENHTREMQTKGNAIPQSVRGALKIDEFCRLPADPDIDQAIRNAESDLAIAKGSEEIKNAVEAVELDTFSLPVFKIDEIEGILQSDLDILETAALDRVQKHFAALGGNSESWVREGINRIIQAESDASEQLCPFCAQPLGGVSLIQHYQSYFSNEYAELKKAVDALLNEINAAHNENVPTEFERKLRISDERQQFWSRYCDIEEFAIDTVAVFEAWKNVRESIVSLLSKKQLSPLEKINIPKEVKDLIEVYSTHIKKIEEVNQQITNANRAINAVKKQADSAELNKLSAELDRLKATKRRHSPEMSQLCADYLEEAQAKAETEAKIEKIKGELEQYRKNVFPKYEKGVNDYLVKFGASFRLEKLRPQNIRGGATSTYSAKIGDASIEPVKANPSENEPSFKNVFSGGDRRTLAFAFFLVSLDQHPDLAHTIVVIDDPMSSMDEGRSLTTAQLIRDLSRQAGQVIVLSHSRPFLHRLWQGAYHAESTALEIIRRQQNSSTLRQWDIAEDLLTEHDRRRKILIEYLDKGIGEPREIAQKIRFHLEGFLRVACPEGLQHGDALGKKFIDECQKNLNRPTQILDEAKLKELESILEYAHKFHHDTNSPWENESINDNELRSFVQRTLNFTRP